MFTQSAPAIVNALNGTLPDTVVKQLIQALGNCNQPLAHRGPVQFQPRGPRESIPGGIDGDGQWSPQDYFDLLPELSQQFDADMPGWGTPGGWGNRNFYGDTFNFPTSQEFTLNNYYGGPNVFNAGDSYFNNAYTFNHTTENQYTTNLNVTYINGRPVQGPAGRPGDRGVDGIGLDGWDGLDGRPGRPGEPGRDGREAILPPRRFKKFVSGITPRKASFTVVTDVSFDPDTCQLNVDRVDLPEVVTGLNVGYGGISYL